jgi:predicted AlkP superfamily phosphohydrolase/phosphomutase
MTAKCALALALLEGRVLTVYNCMKEIGYSNIAREIPRVIEKDFGVKVSRVPKESTNRYGDPVKYTEYRLNVTEQNKEGREKLIAYCKKEIDAIPKTNRQSKAVKALKQVEMFPVV